VYWIDPRRLGALDSSGQWVWDDRTGALHWAGQVSLRSMALQPDPLSALPLYTDGRAVINRNDLASAMKDIVRDMSGYYRLGYNSTLDAYDGTFHEISVHVKRPGVTVRARKGYWAYTKNDLAGAGGGFIVLRAGSAAGLRQLRALPGAASTQTPVFRRGEHVLVRARMADLDPSRVSAALLNSAGDHLLDIPIDRTGARAECEPPLASLAAGIHLLDISDDQGGAVRTLLASRVEKDRGI
jgi:hypothetical protein